MPTKVFTGIRLLLFTLPLAGILFALGIWLRGPSLDPAADPLAYAHSLTAANAPAAWLGIFLGMIIVLPGLWALYAYLTQGAEDQPAFLGLVLSLIGIALVLPLIGFTALAAPVVARLYLQGQQEVMAVAVAMAADGPSLIIASLSGLAYTVGSLLLAVVMWRNRWPKWVAIAYALQAPLLAIVALFSVTAEFMGALLLLFSSGWIAWRAWNHAGQETPEAALRANF